MMTTTLVDAPRDAEGETDQEMDVDARVDASDNAPAVADPRWRAVLARDRAWDGAFVFGVTSTGIFCKPSCPAKRPREDRVAFYADPGAARQAGFRACKRCTPESARSADSVTPAIVRALQLLDGSDVTVSLPALATAAGISRSHLQREFTRLVGCSPHEWQVARRAQRLRSALGSGTSVSRAAYEAGFDSLPSAYAAAEQHLGMSPGAMRRGAAGEVVFFTITSCPLGCVLVAMTSRGVSRVILGDDAAVLEATLRSEMHAATLVADDAAMREVASTIVQVASGHALAAALPLDLQGTAFQQRVWRELTRIPRGETITYAELAKRIGAPGAVRAVGSACGANPTALVVPCHRVIRSDGGLGGYRWGLERKATLLQSEQAPEQG